MLPKCCHNLSGAPLIMLILIKYHLELKNGVSNVIIEDLGGWMGRNVADFLGDLNQTHISSKTKKIWSMYPESTKFNLFSNFMMIFAYITSIFVGPRICSKIGFLWNFKGPQNLDEGGGDPRRFSGRVRQQHLTPKNTDKYVRTSGTVPKFGNKIFSEKKPERNLENT